MIPEYYICRMKKNIWFILTGFSILSWPVFAQPCPLVPTDVCAEAKVTVSVEGGEKEYATCNAGLAGNVEESRMVWIQRYLSVSLPLRKLKVTSPYGFRRDPFTGKNFFHGGLDLHARGEKVMAMMAGIVVKVGQDNASGKYVVLRHGNYQVSYCHLSRILVETGRKVCPAEPVGITGSTGRSTGEHLHITCKLNGRLVNPWMLIRHISSIREECVEALVRLEQTVNAISGTSL